MKKLYKKITRSDHYEDTVMWLMVMSPVTSVITLIYTLLRSIENGTLKPMEILIKTLIHTSVPLSVFVVSMILCIKIAKNSIEIIKPSNPMYDVLNEKLIIITTFYTNLFETNDYGFLKRERSAVGEDEHIAKRIHNSYETLEKIVNDDGLSYLFFNKINTIQMQNFLTKLTVLNKDDELRELFYEKQSYQKDDFLNPLSKIINELEPLLDNEDIKYEKLKNTNYITKEMIEAERKRNRIKELDALLENTQLIEYQGETSCDSSEN